MENLSRVETLLLPGDFLTNIELKGGYLSIPVHKSSRFIWQGKCYQFKAPPFGLCSSPRIFTILLKTVAAFLRKKSIRVLLHLDDSLLFGSNKRGSNKKYQLLITLFRSLGFTINLENPLLGFNTLKVLRPRKVNIDSLSMVISLPVAKVHKILDCCHHLATSPPSHYDV